MVSLSLYVFFFFFFFFLKITTTDSFLFPLPPWRGIRQLLAIGPWGHILDNIQKPPPKKKRKKEEEDVVLWIHDPSAAETKLIHSSKLPPCKDNHRRIVSTSDTHGKHRFVHIPPCDIFIHCGDILQRYGYFGNIGGGLSTLNDFVSWLHNPNLVPAKHGVVVIGGNHDILLEQMGQESIQSIFDDYEHPGTTTNQNKKKKCYYIENAVIDICNITIYGSPWSPIGVTDNLAFQSGTNASDSVGLATAAAVTTTTSSSSAACDDDTTSNTNIDILITHASCKEWEKFIKQNPNTKLWVHGHWHDGQGKINQIFHNGHKEQEQSFCISVNVASNDMIYRPKNPPIVIDIPISTFDD